MTDTNRDGKGSFKIGRSKVGTRTVLSPSGPFTENEISEFEKISLSLAKENRNEIIIDMKSVSFLDSAALEFMLKTHFDLKSRGGRLKFINVNAICMDIFIVTRLINSLLIFEDIHEAIRN